MGRHQDAITSYREESTAFNSYMECMTRAYTSAFSAFATTFGCSYFGQRYFIKHLPYNSNYVILASSLVSCLVGYKVATRQARICQNAWMAQEDKHTFLNPIADREIEDTSS